MKFIVAAPDLLEHLLKVNGAIVSKPVLPILDNFLFDIFFSLYRFELLRIRNWIA